MYETKSSRRVEGADSTLIDGVEILRAVEGDSVKGGSTDMASAAAAETNAKERDVKKQSSSRDTAGPFIGGM